jgi:predicted RNA binding protein YcfA (HicA-like mRNA interferase family)
MVEDKEFPLLSGQEVIKRLKKKGFIVVRQKGSHIRLENTILN